MTPGSHGPSKPSSNQPDLHCSLACVPCQCRPLSLKGREPSGRPPLASLKVVTTGVRGMPAADRPARRRERQLPLAIHHDAPRGSPQRELTKKAPAAVYLQRQVFMLDGATGLPAHGAGPCRTSMPNRGGSVDSGEDRGRLLPLAETEEIVEAAQPSGPGLIPRGCALQEQAARTSSSSARLRPRDMRLEIRVQAIALELRSRVARMHA